LSVFLDFDGTITLADTGVYLLEQLAPPAWLSIEAAYVAGEIGSRECMAREWALLPRDRALIEATARQVPLDPGFAPLVRFLRQEGAEVSILSDGFGWRAEEVGAALGIPVITNAIDWESWAVAFPNEDLACECAQCGACKRAPIRAAKARGRTTALVGDGASDVKGAAVADAVFAKDDLADWCESHGVVFERFLRLADVHRSLQRPRP
jgi:HAD superfamily phosphoserine phosphatase-like hydrolase